MGIAALALALGALASLDPAPARATVYNAFDFETPEYGSFPRRLADHYLFKSQGVWHLFYTELPSPVTPVCKIGHATSSDLVHWIERPTVITAGSEEWMTTGVWAPHVTASPGGGWTLLFTGRNDFGSQAIAAMTSGNLDNWLLAPENPVYTPPPTWALWGDDFACSCRDAFVYFESGMYSMIFTAYTNTGHPALGRATSLDLLHWNDMGPFAIDSTNVAPTDIESASLVFDNGRVELHYTRFVSSMLIAPTSAGPWDFEQGVEVDPLGGASEIVKDGNVRMLSRLRFDDCGSDGTIILIDTVGVTPTGYSLPAVPPAPPGWLLEGDAFFGQPVFADGPALRGQTPALPQACRWLGSGESYRNPGSSACTAPEAFERTGSAQSPRFVLKGDVLAYRLMGKTATESTYVALLDDCTGLELARQTGPGTTALTPFSWSNNGRRGWPVRLVLKDLAVGPGGVIGLDAVQDSAVGSPTQPALPLIDQTQPVTGQNLTPNTTFTIRWTASSSAGLDSFEVYVSYDRFATPPVKLAKRNASQFTFNWTVPPGPIYPVQIRVVAYAKNAVHACDESGPFTIGVTTGVAPDPGADAPAIALSARGSPGPTPVFAWRVPPGRAATLDLFDVRGRHVRALVRGEARTFGTATWDGRDAAGRLAPAGLYFALLTGGGERRTISIVRLAH